MSGSGFSSRTARTSAFSRSFRRARPQSAVCVSIRTASCGKGLKGATVGLAQQRGGYIDAVTETVKKILNGEEVEDYVAPEVPVGAEPKKDWLTTLLLCIFLGGLGVHRYYVGKIGTGILCTLTAGLFGIGYLVDLIKIICGKFTDKSGNLIQKES